MADVIKQKKHKVRPSEEPEEQTAVPPAKKHKKKHEKHVAAEPEPETVPEAAPEAAPEAKKSKKSKKSKEAPDAAVAPALDAEAVAAWRKKHKIHVENPDGDQPILSFDHPLVKGQLVSGTGFTAPTAVQSECWPLCFSGKDVIAIAPTGSGKTLGFGVPGAWALKNSMVDGRHQRGVGRPVILVVAPTRELALQTAVVFEEQLGLSRTVCVYGGMPKSEQRISLKGQIDAIVATPGRLLDFMEDGCIHLEDVTFCVLDEADRMLDMGFERDIKRILAACTSPKRQTMMFSATWPVEVQTIAASFMRSEHTARISVGTLDLKANRDVEQTVEVLEGFQKDRRLLELLRACKPTEKVLIFVLYKKEAVRVEQLLQNPKNYGSTVRAIHGDLSQPMRHQVLDAFKNNSLRLMIATDVAARGLDVPDIDFVINYTFPLTIEDYVHRIGRCGRAGRAGHAHTFFTTDDKAHAGELGNVLRQAGVEVPEALMNFGQGTKRKKHAVWGEHFNADPELALKKATKITFDDD